MKRHRLDVTSLIFGGIFLAIVASWLVARSIDVALPAFGWFVSLGLILVGVLGLVGVLRGGRRTATRTPAPEPVPAGAARTGERAAPGTGSAGTEPGTRAAGTGASVDADAPTQVYPGYDTGPAADDSGAWPAGSGEWRGPSGQWQGSSSSWPYPADQTGTPASGDPDTGPVDSASGPTDSGTGPAPGTGQPR